MEMNVRQVIEDLIGYAEKHADLNAEPKDGDCRRAIAAAKATLASSQNAELVGLRPPTVVFEVNGGAYYCARSDAPVRLIVLDHDVEGSDGERVQSVDGQDFYIAEYVLDAPADDGQNGVDARYVKSVVAQLTPPRQEGGSGGADSSKTDAADLALTYRVQALALMQQAHAADGLRPFVVTHMHRFGSSAYLVWAPEQPTEEQASRVLDAQFEPARLETLEIETNLLLEELCGVSVASRLDLIADRGETAGDGPGEGGA